MIARIRWSLLLLVLLLAAGLVWDQTTAQVIDQEYFPEKGHWVTKDFLAFYHQVPDPQLLYGYPITEAFQDPTTGLIVQYFERARFELHPEATPELRVQLSPLGQYLYTPGSTLPVSENFPACQAFPETGKQVCYTFQEFFTQHGGVAQFGYPISNFELQDEHIVQYFQRARFEWRPELPPGQRVLITDLGRRYFEVRGEDPARLLPVRGSDLLQTILDLKVRAYPHQAVTGIQGDQTLYITVQDQNLLPVNGAQVSLRVLLPNGEEYRYLVADSTQTNGIVKAAIPFQSNLRGEVKVWVTVNYNDIEKTTVTSFRLWW